MNTPNKLTILRIFLVLPFLSLLISAKILNQNLNFKNINISTILFLISGLIFVLAMLTDFIDGYIARKFNQITTFGKLFDPLSDKIITTSAMILLSVWGIIPILFTIILILRDIFVDGSRNIAAANGKNISASWIGKWKTMTLSIGIILIFLISPLISNSSFNVFFSLDWKLWLLNILIIISTILSLISGYKYFRQIIPFLKSK